MTDATTERAASVRPDLDRVRQDISALRGSVAGLIGNAARLARDAAGRQAGHAASATKGAARRAGTFKDFLGDKIRKRPMAALGAAVLAGLILSQMTRRSEKVDEEGSSDDSPLGT